MRPEQLLRRVGPLQLATLVRSVKKRPADYLYELKFDGYRIVAVKAGGDVCLYSRRGQDWTQDFAVVAHAAGTFQAEEFAIDGEVCALDDRGVPRFQLLQNRAGQEARLAYFVFDALWADGRDLRPLPLAERRARLLHLLGKRPQRGPIALSATLDGAPEQLLRRACASGMEGVLAKEKGSLYEGGRRPSWLKIKCTLGQEFAIVGYVPLLGTRIGEVGSLLIALKGKDDALHYAGKVGTGFTSATRRSLGAALEADHAARAPVVDPPRLGGLARWSRPKRVAQVEFTEWTAAGHTRHPSFRGLRDDKTPDECVRESPALPSREKRR